MSEKPDLPTIGVRHFPGLPLTARMKSMGITGMINYGDGWRAGFEEYGNVLFDMPKPVVDWLLKDGPE